MPTNSGNTANPILLANLDQSACQGTVKHFPQTVRNPERLKRIFISAVLHSSTEIFHYYSQMLQCYCLQIMKPNTSKQSIHVKSVLSLLMI